MDAVPFAARQVADLLLLVLALKIEAGDVGPGVHLAIAHLDRVMTAGDFLVDGLFRVERVAVLIDVAQLDGIADADIAALAQRLAVAARLAELWR